MNILVTLPEEGFAPSVKILDDKFANLSTNLITNGIYWNIDKKIKEASASKVKMEKFYEDSEKLYPTLKLEIEMFPCVEKNYNGYKLMWYAENKNSKSLLSLDEFIVWNKTHKAKYKDNTWIYEEV